jgi:hypothetical protein
MQNTSKLAIQAKSSKFKAMNSGTSSLSSKKKTQMKNFIPTFDQFIGESTNPINEAKVKDFDSVKPGDMAEDYHGEKWKVLAKGTGKDFWKTLSKFDDSGIMADMAHHPDRYGMSKRDFEELDLIAVQMKGENAVFTYEPEGACVYESMNEAKEDYVPATVIKDSGDLRKGETVKVDALDYTKRGGSDKVTIIRPDGKKEEILKGNLSVKI